MRITRLFRLFNRPSLGGAGAAAPGNALRWSDGTPLRWSDGTYIVWGG